MLRTCLLWDLQKLSCLLSINWGSSGSSGDFGLTCWWSQLIGLPYGVSIMGNSHHPSVWHCFWVSGNWWLLTSSIVHFSVLWLILDILKLSLEIVQEVRYLLCHVAAKSPNSKPPYMVPWAFSGAFLEYRSRNRSRGLLDVDPKYKPKPKEVLSSSYGKDIYTPFGGG